MNSSPVEEARRELENRRAQARIRQGQRVEEISAGIPAVAEVRREMVVVAGAELEISRRNRTAFLTALTDYVGGNG